MDDSTIWEPWQPEVGARVRVRLSNECRVGCREAAPPPHVSNDDLRAMMRTGIDVGVLYARDIALTSGHPAQCDGIAGTVTLVDRDPDKSGHYYQVMFDHLVEPGALIGMDLAAIELVPDDGWAKERA